MKVSKALVTGGAGFIGSHIVDNLISREIETYVIDDLSTGSLANLQHHKQNKLLHMIVDDARKITSLLSDVTDIDVVFHEAAIASVPKSVINPMLVHDVNVNTTLEIMNFCVKKGIKRIVFASTAAVYGTIKDKQASEEMLCKPISPYGASKLSVENYLDAYSASYGLETVALRYFNVYGARQIMNDYSGVITIFTNQLLRRQTPTVHGDGKQTRDFVNVKDIVQANLLAMESKNAVGGIFNVATGKSITILQLLEVLKSITKTTEIVHKFGPQREGDIRHGLASIDKITSIGYAPKVSVDKGLVDVVEYLRTKSELLQGIN
ncbi:NAD-dependent epimerase/dehydratase family protein [Candidatus Nitrosotalea okcheonensis]|uniref:Putative UDP-glucose 4-epimerase n=1 Tax=Candidatus Nitrosotalea okcheonensis TaxID=1903276 RepID=A0A2H1FF89_9ARCH|nr:NAD-dependent epimerase/dehydratase family protein [Candidatus Nitrosotalea okcheonensis]SMH71424.1 putative UDP-glucose 4-epimerase [Candidatus Nitrosotalea okcheonensis]